jgi:hypothetical protein
LFKSYFLISNTFITLLQGLDLYNNPSVFFLKEGIGDKFALKNKELKGRLTAIAPTAFFIFNNQPLILFFDLSENLDLQREKEIHKKVWSFDQSPLIFIIKANEIKIFNAFSYNKRNEQLEEINLSKEERNKQFSFWNLQSGNTWKWLQSEYYEKKNTQKKRVNQKLFENIKFVREKLTNSENKLTEEQANSLILRLIFIRYLIDRNVKIDEAYIQGKELKDKRKSLIDLIEKPRKLNSFFVWLNDKFNGTLFKDIKFELSKEQAKDLSNVFKGEKVENNNIFYGIESYFEIFDFSIIPVELISGIYESLITKETQKLNSAVYTPSFLVEHILIKTVDDFFDKNKETSEVKIFDPAVGSGIFLVQSFRRMVDREMELTKNETVKKSRLKEIIQKNLFGIDKSPQALQVTCFSIYIAILDYQTPRTILDKFHFPNLIGENLFERNFFKKDDQFDELIKRKNIDFILGNPPWQNNKEKEHLDWLRQNNLLDIVSDFQIAQSYTLRTAQFSVKTTKCCFIITSKAIYNNNADDFRKYFLENFYLTKCFDLSPVRHLIFKGADSPAMIINFHFAKGEKSENNIVEHQSLKHNIFIKYFNTLVLEKFDIKKIKQIHFIENSWMFKVALYGGVLDFQLMKKLSYTSLTIKSYIKNIDGFSFGDGIKKHSKNSLSKLKKVPELFNEISEFPIIETDEQAPFYVSPRKENLPKSEDLIIKSGRRLNLYKGDKLLFSPNLVKETELIIPYTEGNSIYREKTLSITANKNFDTLKTLFAICNSDLYAYFQFLVASNWGIYYPQILQTEYLSFPIEEINKFTSDKLISLSNKIISSYKNKSFLSEIINIEPFLMEINEVLQTLYNINKYERDLIDYTLKVARYQFQESKEKQKYVTDFTYIDESDSRNRKNVLESYADVFIEQFKDLYKDEYLQIEVYALDYFIAMNFVFKKEKINQKIIFNQTITTEKGVFKALSNNLTISKVSEKIFVQKDIKGFEENSFYIIKPNEYKCWHRAMAWYDVAEIKKTIEEAEIDYLKDSFNV